MDHHHHVIGSVHPLRRNPSQSDTEGIQQRDRATAFLSGWIQDNTFSVVTSSGGRIKDTRFRIHSDHRAGSDSDVETCGSRSSGVSIGSIDDIEDKRCGTSDCLEGLEDLKLNEDEDDHLHASSGGIRDSESLLEDAPRCRPMQSTPNTRQRRRSSSEEDCRPSKLTTHLTSTNRHPSSLRNKISSRLPWTHPVSGISGEYTGQINNRRQPDGYGALVYKDESTTTSIWENGVPVQPWTPPGDDKKEPSELPSPSLKNNTYLRKLNLGDVGIPRYIVPADSSPSLALEKINSLQTHDFAFVLRSDGQWVYAIIADRQVNFILFVINTRGDHMILRKEDWATSIQLVNPKEASSPNTTRKNAVNGKKARNKQQRPGRRRSRRVSYNTGAA